MKMKTRNMILVALFAALTAVGAFIKIPIPPIPVSLQFFFCAFAGMLLGPRYGMLSQLVYVCVGLMGVPIFTKGGGLSYVFDTSFGYLIGFILAAWVIGFLSRKLGKLDFRNALISVVSGLIANYMIGVPYIYMIMNLYLGIPKTIGWAVSIGAAPFIVKDLAVCVIVALISCRILPILRRADLLPADAARANDAV